MKNEESPCGLNEESPRALKVEKCHEDVSTATVLGDSVAELDKMANALPRYIRTLYPNRYTKQLRQRIVNLNIERLPNEWSVHYSTDHVTYTLVLAVAPTLSEAIIKMHNIVQKNGLNSEEWIVDMKAIPWE